MFSSFSVLLSFNKDGRYKGLSQIISWSAIDEQIHSEAGCKLFRHLVEETGLTNEEEEAVYEGFRLVVANEVTFIGNSYHSYQRTHIG